MSQSSPEKSNDISAIIEDWWLGLHQKTTPALPTKYRAELKRCHEPAAAFLTEGFQSLWRKLPQEYKKNHRLLPWASVACFLAHITQDEKAKPLESGKIQITHFAKTLGTKDSKTDKAPVSTLRFAQLQNARSENEFFTRMIRAIKLIDGKCSIQSIWQETHSWYREFNGFLPEKAANRLAVRWAMEYYS